jgi:hypothetical protein
MSSFQRLSGLPGTGPLPQQFTFGSHGTHTEGLAVQFYPDRGDPWIGNFQRGGLRFDGVYKHPNGEDALIIAGGEGYIVNPESRDRVSSLNGWIQSLHVLAGGELLILSLQDLLFEALDLEGCLWRTRRLSYDGFRNVVVTEREIVGEGWSYFDDGWHRFNVDIQTGRSEGGACEPEDAGQDERLDR